MRSASFDSAFLRVADNAFNYSLLGDKGFTCLADALESCHCYDFRYSVLDEAVAAFDALLMKAAA